VDNDIIDELVFVANSSLDHKPFMTPTQFRDALIDNRIAADNLTYTPRGSRQERSRFYNGSTLIEANRRPRNWADRGRVCSAIFRSYMHQFPGCHIDMFQIMGQDAFERLGVQ
jgi:hypothetical protein